MTVSHYQSYTLHIHGQSWMSITVIVIQNWPCMGGYSETETPVLNLTVQPVMRFVFQVTDGKQLSISRKILKQ